MKHNIKKFDLKICKKHKLALYAQIFLFSTMFTCNGYAVDSSICQTPSTTFDNTKAHYIKNFLRLFKPSKTDFDKLERTKIASFLGWVDDKSIQNNLCYGYYLEPDIVKNTPNPPAFDNAPTTVTAKKQGLFAQYGTSTLTGNVTITQPGRQVNADVVSFHRKNIDGTISHGTMLGDVELREYGKIIIAKDGYWDSCAQSFTLNNGIYRLITPSPTGSVNAWGRGNKLVRDKDGILNFTNATYTSCSPNTNTWRLWGKKIVLNKNTGRGSITHAWIFFHDVPVFYLPYFNFPIDKERKSGFLYPSIGFSGNTGFDFSLPYYFNLASNYDLTFTPRLMNKRGLLTNSLLRYLTPNSNGSLEMHYIGNDKKFTEWQQTAQNQYKPSYGLSRLENASNNRGFFSYKNNLTLNDHWSSNINLNYVSDDYFFQDFGGNSTEDNDQLFSQMDVNYSGENWNFSALTQTFQTLHPLNQSSNAQDQYRRIPQLTFNGDIPNQKYGLDYQLYADFVNFDYNHEYDLITKTIKPIGNRLHVSPVISLPLHLNSIFITPRLQLDNTFYSLQNNVGNVHVINPQIVHNVNSNGNMTNSIVRTLPIFSIDSGMILMRKVVLFSKEYMQTLEPRIFYLFVPYQDQSDIPNFDSSLPAFDFSQLFAFNRFSGQDFIGDTNQISVGITTRFLDSYSANEKMRISLGQMYAFNKHKICDPLTHNCDKDVLTQHNFSPIVSEVQYNLSTHLSAIANLAWEPNAQEFINDGLNIQYQDKVNRIIRFGYNFLKHGDYLIGGDTDNLHRLNLALAFPIKNNWNVVGCWNYNLSHNLPQEFFYGVEYQSCCWAIRLIQNQSFIGRDENQQNTFQRAVYIQFLLKGLGSAGNGSANSILTSQIPNYHDNFSFS